MSLSKMRDTLTVLVMLLATGAAPEGPAAAAREAHLPMPVAEAEAVLAAPGFELRDVRDARPAISDDVTHRGVLVTGDGRELAVKIRPAAPGAAGFNNEPRYELAAYRLQALLLEPDDYVVPPTAIRALPLERVLRIDDDARPTFRGADSVLVVLQAWLEDVTNPPDVLDSERLAGDALYARHVGNLNVFTYLFRHADSNQGNFLVSTDPASPRVFSVDNGVALRSEAADRDGAWSALRVSAIAADTIARLRRLDREALTEALGVVAEFRIESGRLVEVPPGPRRTRSRGVRARRGVVQLGLTDIEIRTIETQARRLLRRVERGRIALLPANLGD